MKSPRGAGWWLGAGALLVVLGAAFFSLRGPRVDVLQVRQAPLLRTLQFSARVATLSRVEIGSTVTGRVARVQVDEGAQVRAGDALVQLESEEWQAALVQAEATERQTRARLAGVRSTGRTAAQAGLAQADATVRAAQAHLDRVEPLVAQGFYSAAQRDEARRALDVARAQQAGARAQSQALAEAGTDMAQAQAQWDVARAAVVAARARLAQATLRAPTNARVLLRSVEPGQIVQPGKPLLTLALAGPTQLVAQVDELFLGQLATGQQATVVADAIAQQRLAARVLSIAPGVDAQRGAIEVRLVLDAPPPGFLREDMTLSVEVETGRRERTAVLPLSVLNGPPRGDVAQVLVVRDGRAQPMELHIGLRTLDAFEVLDGLSEGDVVLRAGGVQAGDKVRPRLAAWAPGQTSHATVGDAGVALTTAVGR